MGFQVLPAIPGNEIVTLIVTAKENPTCTIQHSFIHKGNSAPIHYHERDHESFYVLSGKVKFTGGNNGQHVVEGTPGTIVVAPPYCARAFEALEDSTMIVINNPSGPAEDFLIGLANEPSMPPSKEFVTKANQEYGIHPMETWTKEDIPPVVKDLTDDGSFLEIGGLIYSHGAKGGEKLIYACNRNDNKAHALPTDKDYGLEQFCVSLP